jgi:hypothetical protein
MSRKHFVQIQHKVSTQYILAVITMTVKGIPGLQTLFQACKLINLQPVAYLQRILASCPVKGNLILSHPHKFSKE